jgi:hypothetical protein
MKTNQCQWREHPGDDLFCHTMVQAGTEYCPRHGMMQAAREKKKVDKEWAKRVNRQAPAKVTTNTRRGMIEAGYQYIGNNTCRSCDKPIEWWLTPNQRNAPYDPMPGEESVARSHFATCTRAMDHRKTA